MKPQSTPPTESTSQASSATSTTPIGGGGTRGIGKKRDPELALMRERNRRKKALTQVRALEDLVKSHREEAAALTEKLALAEAATLRWVNRAEETRKRLDFLASCKVKQDGPESLAEIVLVLRIDPRQLEHGSHGARAYLAEEVMEKLREKLCDTAIKALVTSPIMLRQCPAAMKVYQSRKTRWLRELMMNPEMTAMVYHLGQDKIMELWDLIFEAIKDMAMSVPPGTDIKWMDGDKTREQVWLGF